MRFRPRPGVTLPSTLSNSCILQRTQLDGLQDHVSTALIVMQILRRLANMSLHMCSRERGQHSLEQRAQIV